MSKASAAPISASLDIYDDGDYKRPVPKSEQKNCLLVRRPLGRVKPSTYALPGPNFVYGKVEKPEVETWTTDTTTDNVSVPRNTKKPQVPDIVFGRPSPPTTSLTSVITNQYQREWLQQQRVARLAEEAKARPSKGLQGGLKPAAPTAASKGHTKSKDVAPEPVPFKMKRFLNVPSRVRLENLTHLGRPAQLTGTSSSLPVEKQQ